VKPCGKLDGEREKTIKTMLHWNTWSLYALHLIHHFLVSITANKTRNLKRKTIKLYVSKHQMECELSQQQFLGGINYFAGTVVGMF
jgi:hypothetical protein